MSEFNPSYLYRDEGAPACFQVWGLNDVDTEMVCQRCTDDDDMWEREFPVYADEMPRPWNCDRCGRRLLSFYRIAKFRFQLFRVFGNSIIKSLKKGLSSNKQFISPDRW